jgi:hypothetical protein
MDHQATAFKGRALLRSGSLDKQEPDKAALTS